VPTAAAARPRSDLGDGSRPASNAVVRSGQTPGCRGRGSRASEVRGEAVGQWERRKGEGVGCCDGEARHGSGHRHDWLQGTQQPDGKEPVVGGALWHGVSQSTSVRLHRW
jgi:hypothetical protein